MERNLDTTATLNGRLIVEESGVPAVAHDLFYAVGAKATVDIVLKLGAVTTPSTAPTGILDSPSFLYIEAQKPIKVSIAGYANNATNALVVRKSLLMGYHYRSTAVALKVANSAAYPDGNVVRIIGSNKI